MDQPAASIGVSPEPTALKLLYTIPETCNAIGLKKSTVYELVRAQRLRMVKYGKLSFVTDESLRAFVAGLPEKRAA